MRTRYSRIAANLVIASEDIDDARHAVSVNHTSSALNNMEEAMMICGEAIALAHGYKLLGPEAGFHARAIECLVIYTEAYQPGLGIYARRFQALRATRNAMKYDRTPPGEGQLKQYLAAAEAFYAMFKGMPHQVPRGPPERTSTEPDEKKTQARPNDVIEACQRRLRLYDDIVGGRE